MFALKDKLWDFSTWIRFYTRCVLVSNQNNNVWNWSHVERNFVAAAVKQAAMEPLWVFGTIDLCPIKVLDLNVTYLIK